MKIIELHRTITESNDLDAKMLRDELTRRGILLVNIMSSAGSGKTTLLMRLILDLKEKADICVLEADIASDVDAKAVEEAGARSIQAHTDGMCHMDAGMTESALAALLSAEKTAENKPVIVFLENVGNLICPAEYDTGAHVSIMLLSVPEGDDKPLKYPLMFTKSDALVVTKTDALAFFDFDMQKARERALRLNPGIRIFPVSAKTGDGMAELEAWIMAAACKTKGACNA